MNNLRNQVQQNYFLYHIYEAILNGDLIRTEKIIKINNRRVTKTTEGQGKLASLQLQSDNLKNEVRQDVDERPKVWPRDESRGRDTKRVEERRQMQG